MARRFLVAVALCPLALAFSNTAPLLAWSSQLSNALDGLPSNAGVDVLVDSVLFNNDVCNLDAVILIEHPGLHASDLRSLTPSSKLVRSFSSSPSPRQLQYMPTDSSLDLSSIAQDISNRCGSRLVEYTAGERGSFSDSSKHVLSVSLPHIYESGGARKDMMTEHDSKLADELDALAIVFPNHLIVYTGSSSTSNNLFQRRQSPGLAPVRPALTPEHKPVETPQPKGGILKRYQLLTPGLITVLLVTVFILIPVVLIGFSALASIQSPLKVEAPKNYSATEKKTQ